MPAVDVDGTTLHYERQGEGTPVVLLHAIGADGRMWAKLLPRLAPHRDVIVVDLPGHGGSGEPPTDVSTRGLAGLVGGLLDRIQVGTAELIGASMGGTVAVHLAADAPERFPVLGLVSTWHHPNAETRRYFAQLGEAVRSAEAFAELYLEGFRIAVPPPSEAVLRLLKRTAPVPRPSWPALVAACDAHDALARLPGLRARVLTVVGEQDPIGGWQGPLLEAVPGSRLVTVPGGGHNLMFDRHAAVIDALTAFLQVAPQPA